MTTRLWFNYHLPSFSDLLEGTEMTGSYYSFGFDTGRYSVDYMGRDGFDEAMRLLASRLEAHLQDIDFRSLKLNTDQLVNKEYEKLERLLQNLQEEKGKREN